MVISSPFRVTDDEAAALCAATGADEVTFHRQDMIVSGNYRELDRYIQESNDMVCLRLSTGFDFGVLELPITKSLLFLVYIPFENKPEEVLMAVIGYDPIKSKFHEYWRSPTLSEDHRFHYSPTLF